MKPYVIIVAGGKGLRMGNDLPKQFLPVAGKPLLMHTIERFRTWNPEAELVVVLPEAHQSYWNMLCKEIGCAAKHRIVSGGSTRFHSVKNGLAYIENEMVRCQLKKENTIIAVHDGVRPFVSEKTISACFYEAEKNKTAVPVIPIIDSLREKVSENESHPVDRSRFYAVQTPQVFTAPLLLEAYQQPFDQRFTDDASVVEAEGFVKGCSHGEFPAGNGLKIRKLRLKNLRKARGGQKPVYVHGLSRLPA